MRNFFFIFLISITLCAQNGSNDLSFNSYDIGNEYGDGPYNTITDPYPYFSRVAVQSDGKILCYGKLTRYNGNSCGRFIRLNSDGNLDTSFNYLGAGLVGTVNAIVFQNDGKIILGGSLFTYNNIQIQNVIRLNADGSLDTSFIVNIGQGQINKVGSLTLQPDGKIIIVGTFQPKSVIRVDANGILDSTFNIEDNALYAEIYSVAVQSDGKIIIGGNFINFGSVTKNRLLRLNSDGSLDDSFDTTIGADDAVTKVVVLPNNKILIIGLFFGFNAQNRPLIARLNSDGTLDNSFSPGYFYDSSSSSNQYLSSILVQPDGKLLIGGLFKKHSATQSLSAASVANNIIRLNANGTRDNSFTNIGSDDAIYDIALQSNGNFIASGYFDTYDNVARRKITRAFSNGNIDMSFNTGTGANSGILATKVLPDGKIMIAGGFRLYNGVVRNRIAKLNSDGTLDMFFNSNLLIDSPITVFKIQQDGKILIGGNFTNIGGIARNKIARLNADSSLDLTFSVGASFNSYVTDIAIQNDGKIIVVGNFTTYNGISCPRIARLNTNGSLDTTFNVGTGANDSIFHVAIQNDGKVIIGGYFTSFNGSSKYGLLRLNSDGSTDSTFLIGSGLNGNVRHIEQLPNGKILICGGLAIYNNVYIGNIIRLNSNGTLDTTFISGANSTASIETFIILPDGKIVIGGSGLVYSNNGSQNIVKLDVNGNFDSNFSANLISTTNSTVRALGQQDDGKIIACGDFTKINTLGRNRIARINNTITLNTNEYSNNSENIIVYKENDNLFIDSRKTPLKTIYVYDLRGRLLYENQNITDTKFAIENIKKENQLLIIKFIDEKNVTSSIKTIF